MEIHNVLHVPFLKPYKASSNMKPLPWSIPKEDGISWYASSDWRTWLLVVHFPLGDLPFLGCLLQTLVLTSCFFFSPFLRCFLSIKSGRVHHMEFTSKWNRHYSTKFKETCFRQMKFYLMKWFGYELKYNYWEFEKKLNAKLFKEHWNVKFVLMDNYVVMVLDMRSLYYPIQKEEAKHVI